MSATEPAQSPSPRILFPGEWLICFAVKEEAQCFNPPDSAIHTLITGIGCTNVERAIKAAVQKRKPALVLTCGFAGGLDPSLGNGAVLFACDSAPALHATLLAAGAQPAKFHCTDRIAVTAGEKRALRQSTGADAVEMESNHICALCRDHQIPSATVRVILDTAGEDLPLDFNRLMTRNHRINFMKLAFQLIKSPAKIKSLLQLQKQSRSAANCLSAVLTPLAS